MREASVAKEIVRSLAWGIPIPLLFAAYSVFLAVSEPADATLRDLAVVQMCWFATALTSACALLLFALSKPDWADIVRRCRRDWRDLLYLNACTLLGPPLYIFAVIQIGASPANWIDLGATPILTLVAALFLGGWAKTRTVKDLIGAGIAITGLVVVMAALEGTAGAATTVGVVASLTSAVGTAGAGVYIARLLERDAPLPDAVLLFSRYLLTVVCLSVAWFYVGRASGQYSFAPDCPPFWFVLALLLLYVVPNYVYVTVVRKQGLLFSGYMWALLPVFASAIEFGIGKSQISGIMTITAGALVLGGLVVSEWPSDWTRAKVLGFALGQRPKQQQSG